VPEAAVRSGARAMRVLAPVDALSASSVTVFRCKPQADRRRLLLTTPIHRRLAVATFFKVKMLKLLT